MTQVLTQSLLLTHSLTHSLLLTHSLTYSLTHSLTHLLTYLLTHSLTHLLTYSLTHSLTHSLNRPLLLTHSLTYLLTCFLLASYWWNCCVVGNYAGRFYSFAIELVRKLQYRIESEMSERVLEVEAQVSDLINLQLIRQGTHSLT